MTAQAENGGPALKRGTRGRPALADGEVVEETMRCVKAEKFNEFHGWGRGKRWILPRNPQIREENGAEKPRKRDQAVLACRNSDAEPGISIHLGLNIVRLPATMSGSGADGCMDVQPPGAHKFPI